MFTHNRVLFFQNEIIPSEWTHDSSNVIEHGKKSRAIFKAHYKNKIYMYECFIIVIQKVFHPLEHPHSMQYDPIYFTFEFAVALVFFPHVCFVVYILLLNLFTTLDNRLETR